MLQNLDIAYWKHTKTSALLICEKKVLIEIEFSTKTAHVKADKEKYIMTREGFWCPRILITKEDVELAIQSQVGIWGTKSEFAIGDQAYIAKSHQGLLFNLSYTSKNNEILTYKLDAFTIKPRISFQVHSGDIPEEHLVLLLSLGFYIMKNVAIEALSNNLLLSAVA